MDRLSDQAFINKRDVLVRRRTELQVQIVEEQHWLDDLQAEFASLHLPHSADEIRKAEQMPRSAFRSAFAIGFSLALIIGLVLALID